MIGFEDFVKVWNEAARDEVAHASLPPDASSFHHALYMSLQAILGGETAPKETATTATVFVIEASSSTKAKPMLFANEAWDDIWTSDLSKAARFASQQDAELVAQANGFKSVKYREIPA